MAKKNLADLLPEMAEVDFSGFESLSAKEAETLAEAVRELQEVRRHDFDRAVGHALRMVPLPLRGGLRRVLFG